MSYMTTKLRYIVEQALDDLLAEHTESNWGLVYPTLGIDDYPIWTPTGIQTGPCEDRTRLNNKLIRHYFMREIGLETVALFRWYLRDAFLNIMPYYNEMYRIEYELVQGDPLKEYEETSTEKMQEGHTEDGTTTEKTDTTDTSTTSDTNIYSETPENMIPSGDVKNLRYATNVTYDDMTMNGTTNVQRGEQNQVNYDGNRTTGRETSGHRQSVAKLLQEYRNAIINVDQMVLEDNEIQNCFMLIYE